MNVRVSERGMLTESSEVRGRRGACSGATVVGDMLGWAAQEGVIAPSSRRCKPRPHAPPPV